MSSIPIVLLNFVDGRLEEIVSDSPMRVLCIDDMHVPDHCYEMKKPNNPARLAELLANSSKIRQERFEKSIIVTRKKARLLSPNHRTRCTAE